jgi:signal transduction histidine kinase/CheY-like chemotaxis protein
MVEPSSPPAPRVLLVDPDTGRRRRRASALSAAGYDVVQAEDAAQTLALVARRRAELVILLHAPPGLDGLATCRRIRAELALPLLPVVLAAATPTPALRAAATAAGADELLNAEVEPDELAARLANLVRLRDHFVASEAERVQHEDLARRWRLVSAVAEAVASCHDHGELTAALLGALRPVVPIDGAALCELEGDELIVRALDLGPGLLARISIGARLPAAAPAWRAALRAERVVAMTRFDAATTPLAGLLDARLPAAAIVPIVAIGELEGVLVLPRRAPFRADELDLLAELAPHLANALANVRSRLRAIELDAARQRLSTFLVHDLKNPLAVIKLALDLLGGERLDPAARARSLDAARAAADTLLEMLVDFLDIARAEDGRLALERRPIAIDQLVGELLVPYAAAFRAASVSLRFDAAPDAVAEVDPKLIRRLVLNLLDNALRFVGRRGRVEVEVAAEPGAIVISVGNDGPAIATELRPHLFDAYGARNHDQGPTNRGLGLYFCRLVATAHGGTITAGDRPGGGARFEVRVPPGKR